VIYCFSSTALCESVDVVLRLRTNLQVAHGKQADETIPTPDAETSDNRFDDYSHIISGRRIFVQCDGLAGLFKWRDYVG
jgi:hypothetical protein